MYARRGGWDSYWVEQYGILIFKKKSTFYLPTASDKLNIFKREQC